MRFLLLLACLALGILALGWILRLLRPLPPLADRPASAALGNTADTSLGRLLAPLAAAHPGLSGILPLSDAHEAFAARMLLIRKAERSLDLQYYIWRADVSGRLLLEEVRKAADRGVRVRLLLDDNGTSGLDRELAFLHRHPHIEVRLFNPFTIRRPKLLGYAMDFFRLNRRMHNKSLTADNQATIIGGRNIGDEYFGASQESLFVDLDVLAAGAVVPRLSADFDRYWESESAYPADRILRLAGEPVAIAPASAEAQGRAQAYEHMVRESLIARELAARELASGRSDFEWTAVQMVSDDPAKGLGKARDSDLLIGRLLPLLGNPEQRLALVSAYFVPTTSGTAQLTALARGGVEVSVLTNALNATDVAVVHAGYAKHRRALLEGGVRLYELKGEGKASLKLTPSGSGSISRPVFRASGSSLHAKTFALDGARIFVGSFNFDPRSASLNTELGFLIDSPRLAGALQAMFDEEGGEAAYEVRLSADGRSLMWLDEADGKRSLLLKEPNSGPLQRTILKLLALLPIDWLL
ncbi:phospholipase D family protein [Sandaracinobacter sp. RS1-74]|uniref:phospholipase D family protein n=1 Tax=Sandaracinobacteroides sayramensis TaxID=2913411 RepID=UPI001EDC22B0|nr:phospholipase D family protein [Sandaracinobacteroides sayramensis]MCG2839827.1 phospholipase D family protein [Sandaracinobacteroides sayramensis]